MRILVVINETGTPTVVVGGWSPYILSAITSEIIFSTFKTTGVGGVAMGRIL